MTPAAMEIDLVVCGTEGVWALEVWRTGGESDEPALACVAAARVSMPTPGLTRQGPLPELAKNSGSKEARNSASAEKDYTFRDLSV